MTTRKRKLPEKQSRRPAPGMLSRGAIMIHGFVARHPFAIGGITAFAVVFGFVSANALWYQPAHHPSPFLRTRDASDLNALAGMRANPRLTPDPATVTTFRIERAPSPDDATTASVDGSAAGDAPATLADGSAAPAGIAASAAGGTASLVAQVQEQLARRGLYDGAADGVPGPRTAAAIAAFETSVGMPATGVAGPELLAALLIDGGARAAMPQQRPTVDLASLETAEDPVAAAIRGADVKTTTAARRANAQDVAAVAAPVPPSAVRAAAMPPAIDAVAATGLVMDIQRGLSNIAYTDVTVDGVAGEQTRAAIRHFEHHYRLPETGQPNDKVLKKLRDIGAL